MRQKFWQKVCLPIFLFIFYQSFFVSITFAQSGIFAAMKEDPAEVAKRLSYECFADEKKQRDSLEKTKKVCTDLEEIFKEEIPKASAIQKTTWESNCADGEYKKERPLRPAIPESCTSYGEFLMEQNRLDDALVPLNKACGDFFNVKEFESGEEGKKKVLKQMDLYGCLTPELERKYKITGIIKCTPERILGCLRLGDLLVKQEKADEATRYYKRGCDGGEPTSCERYKNEQPGSNKLMYTALLLIGLAVFLFTKVVFQDESQFKATEQLEDTVSKDETAKHGAILKFSRPIFKRYVSPIVSTLKMKKTIREKYKRPLAAAGLTQILTPEDFYSFKLFLIIGFPVAFLGIKNFMGTDWPLSIIPIISIVGYFYPDLWIRGKISQRQEEVIHAMPFCVDMLALSVEAGLDFIAAMTKVVEKAKPSALTEEFQILIKEIKIGASRAEALRNLAWRVDLIQISSFTATLIAADSVGASIGPILKSLAIEIRQKKSSDIEKKGATAATKILFPMLFLITPAVLLIVAGPLVVEFIAGNS